MHDVYSVGLVSIISLIASILSYKPILKLARKFNFYDNPDARKLQRIPIPVMGGGVVLLGIIAGSIASCTVYDCKSLLPIQVAMVIMLFVGSWDDRKNLSPYAKFAIETIVVLLLAIVNNSPLNNLHGLWGIHEISPWLAWPLTVIACVGIINAINMIDGIDGLSSGFCIMIFSFFSWMIFNLHDFARAAFGMSIVAGLVPFFVMNVFSRKSKMFIGDAGTMMLGIAVCDFVMIIVSDNSELSMQLENKDVCVVAFLLAVLAIPVFDTLRVMIRRIVHGQSPFRPDKTHLHHAFIDYGFHHLETTLLEILINMIIVLFWAMLKFSHLPMQWQLYGVIVIGVAVTVGLYQALVKQRQEKEEEEDHESQMR